MRWNKLLWLCAAAAVFTGCATPPSPTPVEGEGERKAAPEKPTMAATMASVTLEDVPLGVPVALRLPDGGYYALRNDSSATLHALVAPMIPTFCERVPGQPAYSPISNLDWVAIEPREFFVPPHSESEALVVITLPNDEALRGSHLEFWIRAQALVGPMGSVALYSRVRLNVAAAETSELVRVAPRPAETTKLDGE